MPKKVAVKCLEGNTKPLGKNDFENLDNWDSDDSKKHCNWCFTLNNYTEDETENIKNIECKYLLFGFEIGEERGTPHLQGFIIFNGGLTFKKVKKLLPQRCRIAWCRGNAQQNIDYCSKSGETFEKGDKPKGQGARTDLETIRDDIISGKKSATDILLENPYAFHVYGRTIEKIEAIKLRNVYRTWMTEGEWHWGVTGSGKSKYAFEDFDPENKYLYKLNETWQDGYIGQQVIIIDDFRGQIPYAELLKMIDCHPNSTFPRRNLPPMPNLAKKIIITSRLHPKDVYCNLSEFDTLDQLYRRINIIEYKKKL